MEIYFDNSATTRVYDEAIDIMVKTMREDYGNPSSLHLKGLDAEHIVKASSEKICKVLRCLPEEIVFTSGGTESNNMAIVGTALAKKRKGRHIVVSSVEHASVSAVMQFLIREGYEVSYVPTNEKGVVTAEAFAEAVRDDTILVSCMHINNEIGSVMPVAEIGRAVKAKNPDLYFHVDAIQSFGKIETIPKQMGCDLMSVSGHKIHGPKGSGFLYIKKGTLVRPIIYGGGQQKNMRSGTENVPAIAGLGVAVEKTFDNFNSKIEHITSLRNKLIEGLTSIDEVYTNTDIESFAPHIASISFVGVRAEVMLHSLEDKGIYVSSGSACSSNKAKESAVLTAIGLDKKRLESTLRFSFGEDNTEEEVDYTINTIKELLPVLRHYVRG
ncbi:cysteine desulfurase [Lachnospiraceae bacterium NE2001]|nr:cysteine desulfurase [Lachnospiraceae bacterium NE2001]